MTERDPHNSRLLVVLNKKSTNAHKYIDNFRRPLQETDWGTNSELFVEIDTRSHLQHENEEYIASRIEDGDIIIGYGGDGLVNTLVNAEVLAKKSDTKSIFLPGGNGNDNSMSLYGRKIKKFNNVLYLLNHGEVQPKSTIKVTKDGGNTRHALGYVGFGLTALAAQKIDHYNHRDTKKNSILPDIIHDAFEVSRAIYHREPFEYIANDTHGVGIAEEISFVNIDRMAKLLKISKNPNEKSMTCIQLGQEHFVLDSLTKIVKENFRGGLTGYEVERKMIAFESDTKMHLDGEVYDVAKHDIYTVSHNPKTLDVLIFPNEN